MKIRDINYNITSVHYSVHYKNKNKTMKRIRIDFQYFSCAKLIVIVKSYWKYAHNISTYYKIGVWKK